MWAAESNVDSTLLNLAASLEQTSVHDLIAQPAVVFVPSACGAAVLAVMSGESTLCPGDVLVDCDGVDVRGLPLSALQLAIRGPVSSHRDLRVLRDGQGLTLRERLCNSRDLLKWQSGVVGDVAEQHVLHEARLDLMRSATNAVACAFGNSRHGRRTAWTTTRFVLDLLPATRSLLERNKAAVSECLERRLCESQMSSDLSADGRGQWSLVLLVPSDLTDAIVVTVSAWAEISMLVDIPAKTMGYVMRLSSALGYFLVRLALDGDLSEYALRFACLLVLHAHSIQAPERILADVTI